MNPPPNMLHLASRSPRRRLMLREAGIESSVVDSGIDDGPLAKPAAIHPYEWVMALAYLKARAGAERHGDPGALVLGADTVVIKDGAMLGQPRDEPDARRMIRALRNGRHEVVTGVALVRDGTRRVFADVARVRVGEVTDDQIDAYLASGDWRGKAGAYNLSERRDAGWPIEVDGDPATVMGLPMRRLLPLLRTAAPAEATHA